MYNGNNEPISCAMRGRNHEKHLERGRSNGRYKQCLEMGRNISNTITTVQKDALVCEPSIGKTDKTLCLNSKVNGKQPSLEYRVYDSNGISTAMTTSFHPNIQTPSYRIRKLTPRECFRLMGVSETDIDKIQQSGISNSQQYKMAGNSIVVDVMYYIFKNMFAN